MIQAGAAERGEEIAAATADVIYAAQPEIEGGTGILFRVKGRAENTGGKPTTSDHAWAAADHGAQRSEAQDIYHGLQELIDPMVGLPSVHNAYWRSVGLSVDGPVPEPPEKATSP